MAQVVIRTRLLPAASFLAAAAAATGYASFVDQAPFCSVAQADAPTSALDPNSWIPLKLKQKTQVSHNTAFLRFELPDNKTANLPVASCLLTKAPLQGPEDDKPKVVIRPYTPVSPPDAAGYLDLVVKSYPTGKMSKHLVDLPVGATVDFKGPIPKYPYTENSKKVIGMVAGGTGITPMLQVADHILGNPGDKTSVSLVFANVSESDILLKDHIDGLAKKHPDRFKVFYVVDKPRFGGIFWKGGVGYVTKDIIAAHLPPPSDDNLIMVCGPPPMMAAISGDKAPDKSQGELQGLLKGMGYSAQQVYKF